MPNAWKLALLGAVVLVMGADMADPEPKPPKPPAADVRGKVAVIMPVRMGNGQVLAVEGRHEADTSHDRAGVTVGPGTAIAKWVGGRKVKAAMADIKPGCIVQCVFDGKVLQSLPVQARAIEVLILAAPKK